jgi:triphosphatase
MPKPFNREIEAKYKIIDPAIGERIASVSELSTGFTAEDKGTESCLDIYYDTSAYDLLRRGLALRVRQSENETLVSTKTLGGRQISALHQRDELESQVESASGKPPFLIQCSSEMQNLVREHNPLDKKLRPILNLYQARTKRIVSCKDGEQPNSDQRRPLAELSLDEVQILSRIRRQEIDSLAKEEDPIAEFRELELELLPGGEYKQLRLLARRLSRRRGLRKAGVSKLEAGLAALADSPGVLTRSNIQPEMHMAEACRLIWRRQAMQIVLLEHGVRADDDPEYVHDMRVAIRRSRTAYELFGHYFRQRDVEALFAELRLLARRLGRVRDLDVALENLQTFRKELPVSDRAGVDKLIALTRRKRESALAKLMDWLNSKEHASLIADLMRFTASPGKGVKKSLADTYLPRPIQVRHCMPGYILDRFERVRAYEPLIESTSDVPVDQLHALRIECKYLRYVLEFNRHLMGADGNTLIQQLKTMQDHLGDLNDCDVEYRRLAEWEQAELDQNIVQQRMAHLTETADRLRHEFPARFWEFLTLENRRLLGTAIANI